MTTTGGNKGAWKNNKNNFSYLCPMRRPYSTPNLDYQQQSLYGEEPQTYAQAVMSLEDYTTLINDNLEEDPGDPPEPLNQDRCTFSRYWPHQNHNLDCDPVIYFYHPDYLGHTEYITDRNGDAYQYFQYSAFGETLIEEHSGQGTHTDYFRFNGKELDPETGNYYYGARYYDPKVSVWLSVDPLAHLYPSQSPYNFVLNNPINLVDPDGRSAKCETCPDDEEYDFFRDSPSEYTYNEETDEVTREGGQLPEVTVQGDELTLQERGNLWVKQNIEYSYADAERMLVEEKGYDYELYKMMKKLNQVLEFPEESNTTSQAEDLTNKIAFIQDYTKKSDAYNKFAREYTYILLSDTPMLKKVSKIRSLMKKYEVPNIRQSEIENKFYELNPALDYLRDE